MKVVVASRWIEAERIAAFELQGMDSHGLPAVEPGAHIDVSIPGGVVRQYSICNVSREPDRYRIAVLKEMDSRGGSLAMHDDVKVGDVLEISAPRNHFGLHPTKGKSILLAGGIGITPIIAMANHLSLEKSDFVLHYGARSRSSMAFFDQLSTSIFADKVRFYFDDDASSGKLDSRSILAAKSDVTHVYVCGPKGFIDHHLDVARQLGWKESQLHREHFSATAPISAPSDSFEIVLAKSAKSYTIPSGKRIIDVLWDNGYEIPVSCEQGVCGTCLTPVLEGVPDHRDSFLTDEERAANNQFTPCCSRALTPRLVVDL